MPSVRSSLGIKAVDYLQRSLSIYVSFFLVCIVVCIVGAATVVWLSWLMAFLWTFVWVRWLLALSIFVVFVVLDRASGGTTFMSSNGLTSPLAALCDWCCGLLDSMFRPRPARSMMI